MSKWTPGKWVVGWIGDGYGGVTGPRSVAGVWLQGHCNQRTIISAPSHTTPGCGTVVADVLLTDEFAEADARLIAEAPAMAELLKESLVHVDWDTDEPRQRKFLDSARALLARLEADK